MSCRPRNYSPRRRFCRCYRNKCFHAIVLTPVAQAGAVILAPTDGAVSTLAHEALARDHETAIGDVGALEIILGSLSITFPAVGSAFVLLIEK